MVQDAHHSTGHDGHNAISDAPNEIGHVPQTPPFVRTSRTSRTSLISSPDMLPTIEWNDTGVVMIDQRKLPVTEVYVTCRTANEVARAIKTMVIRGAPAIGVAAAMGIALGMKRSTATGTKQFTTEFQRTCDLMAATRPTAVNLFWAIERMKTRVRRRRAGRRLGRRPQAAARGPRRAQSMTTMWPAAGRWASTARRWCPRRRAS